MMQPRQSQSKEEEVKKKQHKLGQMLHIYELFMHIKKFSKRSNQKLEITVAGSVPVSSAFIFVSLSASASRPSLPLPFSYISCFAYLHWTLTWKIFWFCFLIKEIPVQVKAFSRVIFLLLFLFYLMRGSPLHSTNIASRSAMHLLIKICLFWFLWRHKRLAGFNLPNW